MAVILLGVGLALVIASKIFYNQRCAAGQGIPYNQKKKADALWRLCLVGDCFYVGCVQFSVTFLNFPDVGLNEAGVRFFLFNLDKHAPLYLRFSVNSDILAISLGG